MQNDMTKRAGMTLLLGLGMFGADQAHAQANKTQTGKCSDNTPYATAANLANGCSEEYPGVPGPAYDIVPVHAPSPAPVRALVLVNGKEPLRLLVRGVNACLEEGRKANVGPASSTVICADGHGDILKVQECSKSGSENLQKCILRWQRPVEAEATTPAR